MRVSVRAACLALCVLSLSGCRQKPSWDQQHKPNLLIIVLDTMRADRLAAYGGRAEIAPFLNDLAASSIVFANAFAPSAWTRPSIASLFTSRYASQHNVTSFLSSLSDSEVTLAEVLQKLGYATGGFSANPHVGKFGGFTQGFERFESYSGAGRKGVKVRAGEVIRDSLGWLNTVWNPASPRPVFLYLQLMEPHLPYTPPEPFRSQFRRQRDPKLGPDAVVRKMNRAVSGFLVHGNPQLFNEITPDETELLASLYDGEIASMDAELKPLFEELQRGGFLDNAIVIVTSDHGEEFKERGLLSHGNTLYSESIHVPLLMRISGYTPGTIRQNVSLVDVVPTILELLGAPLSPHFEGHSLVSALSRPSYVPEALWADGQRGNGAADVISELPVNVDFKPDMRRHSGAIIRDTVKALVQPPGGTELYDLRSDPGERSPNPAGLTPRADELVGALRDRSERLARRANPSVETFELDETTKERLRALGYPLDDAPQGAAAESDGG